MLGEIFCDINHKPRRPQNEQLEIFPLQILLGPLNSLESKLSPLWMKTECDVPPSLFHKVFSSWELTWS
jgi:hypothetical protein